MSNLPKPYVDFSKTFEDVFSRYESLGKAASEAGPLNERERALVKLATAAGAGMEGAVHAHCRRALEKGLSPDEIKHAIVLGITTLGFPSMMANLTRIDDILNKAE